MKYLSLYKTSSEHSADNSRLTPNISLITDEQRLILTNENNIDTTFTEVDIIESFDDIINRFPSPTEKGMPGLKIYGDNTDQSKAKNIKLFNDAQEYRSNYLSHNGLSDTGQNIIINVDALIIDDQTISKYNQIYGYHIDIYNDRIILITGRDNWNGGQKILTISNDGSVQFFFNQFPSSTDTWMPNLKIYTDNTDQSKAENIKLYNGAQEYRNNNGYDYVFIGIDALIIDDTIRDKYDGYYKYAIRVGNDNIMLCTINWIPILTIFGDGSVYETLPTTPTPDSDTTTTTTMTPKPAPDSDTTTTTTTSLFPDPTSQSTEMPILKIYTDNSDQSKAKNIKLYNDAQQWYNDYSQIWHGNNTTAPNHIYVDTLIIDDIIIDGDDGIYYYNIDIYNDRIILYGYGSEVLTISSDGSIQFSFNKFPTNNFTHMPSLKIYTDNTDQSKSNNIELYNNAIQWRNNYILNNGWSDTEQPISIIVDSLMMDDITIDKYDETYSYQIDIYNDHIILMANNTAFYICKGEVLTIFSDGSVNIFNKFPTNNSTHMPSLKIYADNTDQSKANNIELYNNAIQWRNNYILNNGWSDTGQKIPMGIDLLVIDNKIIDKYDGKYQYHIDIYKDYIILLKGHFNEPEVLTISSDGYVTITNPI